MPPALDPRLVLVHALAPPTPGGTPIVLRRLLAHARGLRVTTVTDAALRRSSGPRLEGPYRYFPRLPVRLRALPGFREIATLVELPLAVLAGIRAAVVARGGGPACVLTVVDGGFSTIAGALAARLSSRPLLIMVFDLWDENAYPASDRLLGRWLERRLMRSAAAVLVYCEAAADHYRAKHGIECEVIATPVAEVVQAEVPEEQRDAGEVLVAGAVYWAQEDSVRRLLAAADRVEAAHTTMLGDGAALAARGLRADAYEPPVSGEAFDRRVQAAGIAFVGLGFETPHPAIVRTATPARYAEFMASGRPMLVHAPPDSHVSRYAREHDFAEVVDVADETVLAAGIASILEAPEQAAARSERALELATTRHGAAAVGERFAALVRRLAR